MSSQTRSVTGGSLSILSGSVKHHGSSERHLVLLSMEDNNLCLVIHFLPLPQVSHSIYSTLALPSLCQRTAVLPASPDRTVEKV